MQPAASDGVAATSTPAPRALLPLGIGLALLGVLAAGGRPLWVMSRSV